MAKKTKLIYVAIPYNHKDEKVRQARFELATRATAYLLKKGIMAFSSITHNHHIIPLLQPDRFKKTDRYNKSGWEFWKRYDELLLSKCDELIIVKAEGWKESIGVNAEIAFAKKHKMQVSYIDPFDICPSCCAELYHQAADWVCLDCGWRRCT